MRIVEVCEDFDEFDSCATWNLTMVTEEGDKGIGIRNLTDYPEDATLDRDLSFVYSIPDMLKMAYKAGKYGESLEMVFREDR